MLIGFRLNLKHREKGMRFGFQQLLVGRAFGDTSNNGCEGDYYVSVSIEI